MTPHHTLSAADRRRLVEAPFPVTRVIPGKSWGGVNLGDADPALKQALKHRKSGADESLVRYGRVEEDQ